MHVWQRCIIGCLALLVLAPGAAAHVKPGPMPARAAAKAQAQAQLHDAASAFVAPDSFPGVPPRSYCCDGGGPPSGCVAHLFNVVDVFHNWNFIAGIHYCWSPSGMSEVYEYPQPITHGENGANFLCVDETWNFARPWNASQWIVEGGEHLVHTLFPYCQYKVNEWRMKIQMFADRYGGCHGRLVEEYSGTLVADGLDCSWSTGWNPQVVVWG